MPRRAPAMASGGLGLQPVHDRRKAGARPVAKDVVQGRLAGPRAMRVADAARRPAEATSRLITCLKWKIRQVSPPRQRQARAAIAGTGQLAGRHSRRRNVIVGFQSGASMLSRRMAESAGPVRGRRSRPRAGRVARRGMCGCPAERQRPHVPARDVEIPGIDIDARVAIARAEQAISRPRRDGSSGRRSRCRRKPCAR